MRTTVDIPDPIYRELRTKAAYEGKTIKELVLRGVESVLAKEAVPRRRRLTLPLIDSDHPGSLHMDNRQIYDLLDLS